MNIRSRSLSGIVPMFVLLGLATGILVSYVQYRETYWGLSEEASGLAVATAEFMQTGALSSLEDGSITPQEKEALLKAMDRLIVAINAQRITISKSTDGTSLLDIGPSAQQVFEVPPDISAEEATVIYAPASAGIPAVMQAFVAIPSHNGGAPFTLMTQISAEPLTKHTAGALHQILIYILTALTVGTVCALITSSILIRSIQDLAQAAEKAADGDYDIHQERSCPIHEINDLWNTFQTATSVLRGVVASSHRQLLDTELLRTEADLVSAFMQSSKSPLYLNEGDLKWSVAAMSADDPDTIVDLLKHDDTLYTMMAVIHPADTALHTAATGTSLRNCFRRLLQTTPLQTVLDDLAGIFSIVSLRIIAYHPADDFVAIHTYQQHSRSFTSTTTPLSGSPMLFHEMQGPLGDRLDLFVNSFRSLDGGEILEHALKLSRTHKGALSGAIAVVSPIN